MRSRFLVERSAMSRGRHEFYLYGYMCCTESLALLFIVTIFVLL